MAFAATQTELEIIRLSEVSQTEKDKYHIVSLICTHTHTHTHTRGIYKMTQMSPAMKQKQTHRLKE